MAAKQQQHSAISTGILGVPGDSGAWVYNPNTGELAGHVLAYGEKMKQAYIAPMEVLFEDIKSRLGAARVELPGGAGVISSDDGDKENIDDKVREVSQGLKQLGMVEQQSNSKRSSGGTETGEVLASRDKGKGVSVGVEGVDHVPPTVGTVAVAGSSC